VNKEEDVWDDGYNKGNEDEYADDGYNKGNEVDMQAIMNQ
jgi:hypothetical protein